jgi:hypothetical protein
VQLWSFLDVLQGIADGALQTSGGSFHWLLTSG